MWKRSVNREGEKEFLMCWLLLKLENICLMTVYFYGRVAN